MTWNGSSQRSSVRLTSLPADVMFFYVVPYLSPSDIGSMSRVNGFFRDMFSYPQPWKNVKMSLRGSGNFQKFPQLLKAMKARQIRDLNMVKEDLNLLKKLLESLPSLERLRLPRTTNSTVGVLLDCASRNELHLKEIVFGTFELDKLTKRQRASQSCQDTFKGLFKRLPLLEEVSIGPIISSGPKTSLLLEFKLHELQQGLICSGRLKSITITNCPRLDVLWIRTVLVANPHLHTLRLLFVEDVYWDSDHTNPLQTNEGLNEVCPCLQVLDLQGSPFLPFWLSVETTRKKTGLTSLDLSYCDIPWSFAKYFNFPHLQKLNLSHATVDLKDLIPVLVNSPYFRWLELNGCHWKTIGAQVLLDLLAASVGSTLQHLGLASLSTINDNHLRDFPRKFPVLRSLDLSECDRITDAFLVEWYVKKENEMHWPKLRKLNVRGCEEITQEVVESVRLKTRNQLVIDM